MCWQQPVASATPLLLSAPRNLLRYDSDLRVEDWGEEVGSCLWTGWRLVAPAWALQCDAGLVWEP